MCIQDANVTHDDKAIVYCDILSWNHLHTTLLL